MTFFSLKFLHHFFLSTLRTSLRPRMVRLLNELEKFRLSLSKVITFWPKVTLKSACALFEWNVALDNKEKIDVRAANAHTSLFFAVVVVDQLLSVRNCPLSVFRSPEATNQLCNRSIDFCDKRKRWRGCDPKIGGQTRQTGPADTQWERLSRRRLSSLLLLSLSLSFSRK